jgi:hypothetical protein
MSDIIRLKRTAVQGVAPTSLDFGELALNYHSSGGKLYYKNSAGTIVEFTLASGAAEIVEAATTAGFPATGSAGVLYVSRDASRVFRWDSSGVYIELGN